MVGSRHRERERVRHKRVHPNYDEGYSWQRTRARAHARDERNEKRKMRVQRKTILSCVRSFVLSLALSLSRSRFDVLKRLTVRILWMDYVRYSWAKDHCHYHTCTRMIHVDAFRCQRRVPVYCPCHIAVVDNAWKSMRHCDES